MAAKPRCVFEPKLARNALSGEHGRFGVVCAFPDRTPCLANFVLCGWQQHRLDDHDSKFHHPQSTVLELEVANIRPVLV